jgi:hypothetical protein
MIAPSRAAGYRRFYLYSALSIAVIATAIAATLLLHELLNRIGFGSRASAQDSSRLLALAAALLVFALPVGGAHLWLILRSLGDPAERASAVRHTYLNVWITFALVAALLTGQSVATALSWSGSQDASGQVALLVVIAVVGAITAWWVVQTPPASPRSRVRAAVSVMLVAMAFLAISAGSAASAAGQYYLVQPKAPFSPEDYRRLSLVQAAGTAAAALVVWILAFAWQRRWPEMRDRLAYLMLAYGVGTAVLLIGLAYAIAGAIRYTRDVSQLSPFVTTWSPLTAGTLLVAMHVAVLLRDRGHNGQPGLTTDRLLLAFPALTGLGLMVGGIGLGWHAILEREIVPAAHLTDDLTQATALILIGAAAYVPAWRAFEQRTGAASALRRFYLFSVICLALVGGLISGVTVLYSAITAIAGFGEKDAGRTALTWIVPTVALAAIFVAHLRLLLRDQRETRSTESVPTESLPAADPLVALLEDVRAGRMSVESAATTIRRPGA